MSYEIALEIFHGKTRDKIGGFVKIKLPGGFPLSIPTAGAALICISFFLMTLSYSHRKYLCLDVTHFDVQQLLQFFEMVRSEGLFAAMRFNPANWFFFTLEPMQYFVMLLYAAAPSVYTLFVLQTGALSAALFLSYLLASQISGKPLVGLAVVLALALNPYLWTFALMGWRSYLLTTPFFLAFFYANAKGAFKWSIVFLALAGLGKVNLMFMATCFGLFVWLREPKRKHGKAAFFTCALLTVFMVGAAAIAKNHLNLSVSTEEMHLSVYGDTVGEAVWTMISRPVFVIHQILIDANAAHLFVLISFLFVPILAGGYFLCALPEMGMILLSSSALVSDVFYQNIYPDIYAPIVFVHNNHFYLLGAFMGCFAIGVARLYGYFSHKSFGMMNGPYMLLSVVFLSMLARLLWPPMIGGPIPLNIHYDARYYEQTTHDELGWQIAGEIPDGASVRAQWNLFPKPLMKGHPRLRSFEWNRNDMTEDYIFVDLFAFEYLLARKQYLEDVRTLLTGGRYGVARFEDGYVLMKKGHDNAGNAEALEFIFANEDLLRKNLFRPYRDRILAEPKVGRDVYSETQLARLR